MHCARAALTLSKPEQSAPTWTTWRLAKHCLSPVLGARASWRAEGTQARASQALAARLPGRAAIQAVLRRTLPERSRSARAAWVLCTAAVPARRHTGALGTVPAACPQSLLPKCRSHCKVAEHKEKYRTTVLAGRLRLAMHGHGRVRHFGESGGHHDAASARARRVAHRRADEDSARRSNTILPDPLST